MRLRTRGAWRKLKVRPTLRRGARKQPPGAPGPAPYTHAGTHRLGHTHTHNLSRTPCAMQNSGGEARPPRGPTRGSWQGTCVGLGGVGWLRRSSPTDVNCAALAYPQPQAFPLQILLPSLRCSWAVGRAPSQARVHFCAPPQARSRGAQGHPESTRASSTSAYTWTAPGARPRPPADTSVVGHACSGARPSGQALPGAEGKLGRTRAGLGALRRSPASAEPQRPLVLLPRLAPAAPSPAFSLSLPLSPDPSSPALPPADRSFSRNPGGAQVSRWDVPVAREGRGCGGARCAHEHLGRLSSHRV